MANIAPERCAEKFSVRLHYKVIYKAKKLREVNKADAKDCL